MNIYSFEPIINKNSQILILGSIPGQKSLDDNQYYAHKYNVFRKIIFKLFSVEFNSDYEVFKTVILQNNIALWDSLKLCVREGSLDANIKMEEPNDIRKMLENQPKIKTIIFNGKASEKFYKKYNIFFNNISYFVMPSTSPANARINFDQKYEQWSIIKQILKS